MNIDFYQETASHLERQFHVMASHLVQYKRLLTEPAQALSPLITEADIKAALAPDTIISSVVNSIINNLPTFTNETHMHGQVFIDSVIQSQDDCNFGIRIDDGRAWVCVNGASVMRFKRS